MNTEILKNNKDVADVLSAIADKLGTTIDHFWPLFIKQQVISGYTSIAFWLTVILLSIVFFKYARYYEFKNNDTRDNKYIAPTFACYTMGALCAIGAFAVFVGDGASTITQIINPEYAALQNLIRMVK